MKKIKILILLNSAILLGLFLYPLTWIFTSKGVEYLSMLSDAGRNFFYLKTTICILYSLFICLMLSNLKKLGVKLVIFWNIFVGLYLLIFWFGGYLMLKFYYNTDAVFDFSLNRLLSGAVGISLIALGLIFTRKSVTASFH